MTLTVGYDSREQLTAVNDKYDESGSGMLNDCEVVNGTMTRFHTGKA